MFYITAALNIYIQVSFHKQVVYDNNFRFIFLLIYGPSLLSQ